MGYSAEGVAFLGLGRFHGVGFQTLVRLGGRDGIRNLIATKDVSAFDALLADAGARFSARSEGFQTWDELRRQLWSFGLEVAGSLVDRGVRLIFEGDPDYPDAFHEMPPGLRPLWVFVRGNHHLLTQPSVAVVGTREPTEEGEFLAKFAVSCARELGAPVVSGLAKGIDRVVHEWCLRLSLPTISVLGTGILKTYPAKHFSLGEAIVERGGALVSEYLPDQGPTSETFVWRNRLQAALSKVVVPAEWSRKSGTAHTVRFARSLSRPVFGLTMFGVDPKADAGDADITFQVPKDHMAFRDAISAELLRQRVPQSPAQIDLFRNLP